MGELDETHRALRDYGYEVFIRRKVPSDCLLETWTADDKTMPIVIIKYPIMGGFEVFVEASQGEASAAERLRVLFEAAKRDRAAD